MFSKKYIVPVVKFHSVGIEKSQWIFSYLSEPLNVFEKKIAKLTSSGYKFVFWQELYNHMHGSNPLKTQSIMLNFDDGYLDNWVYVFPMGTPIYEYEKSLICRRYYPPKNVSKKITEFVQEKEECGIHMLARRSIQFDSYGNCKKGRI